MWWGGGYRTDGEPQRWLWKWVLAVDVVLCVFRVGFYKRFQVDHGGCVCVCFLYLGGDGEEEWMVEPWGWMLVLCSESISCLGFVCSSGRGYDGSDSDGRREGGLCLFSFFFFLLFSSFLFHAQR